jgi:molecular chaperone GrpE (heat shock protein)
MLMYQVDSLRRALVVKEGTHQAQVAKLEDQIRQMKNQLLSSKEVSNQYQRLESDFRNLTERYTDRIENSQEVASNLSKDIFELNYIYRNTTASQLDSQEELLKKLEVVIN